MTDEDRMTELFQAAASDAGAPPPGFDHHDVVAVSRRITARRRSAVIGGAVALLVVAGVGTVAALPRSNPTALTTAAPAGTNADRNAAGSAAAAAAPEAAAGGVPTANGADSPGGTAGANGSTAGGDAASGPNTDGAAQAGSGAGGATAGGVTPGGAATGGGVAAGGGAAGGGAGGGAAGSGSGAGSQAPAVGTPTHPLGPGNTLCANRQDPALRALVIGVLPEAAHATGAATSDICLPGSQRYLSLELGGGVLTVAYLPPGTAPSLTEGASSAPTASHGTVIVAPAPGYGDRVPQLLRYLAPRL